MTLGENHNHSRSLRFELLGTDIQYGGAGRDSSVARQLAERFKIIK